MSDFHKTSAWQRIRRLFKEQCRRTNALCYLCVLRGDYEMAVIDYLTPRTGRSFEIDHEQSVERFPELAMEWANLRPAHQACNRQKHTKDVDLQGTWVKPDW